MSRCYCIELECGVCGGDSFPCSAASPSAAPQWRQRRVGVVDPVHIRKLYVWVWWSCVFFSIETTKRTTEATANSQVHELHAWSAVVVCVKRRECYSHWLKQSVCLLLCVCGAPSSMCLSLVRVLFSVGFLSSTLCGANEHINLVQQICKGVSHTRRWADRDTYPSLHPLLICTSLYHLCFLFHFRFLLCSICIESVCLTALTESRRRYEHGREYTLLVWKRKI